MLYQEISPDSQLSSIVECFWTLTVDHNTQQRVLPDGCADILFRFENNKIVQASVVGVMTRPHYAVLLAGHALLGVRFHPTMATRFLPAPLDRFNNQILPATDLLGNLAERMLKHAGQLTSDICRIDAIQETLLRHAKQTSSKIFPAQEQHPSLLAAANVGDRQRRRLYLEHAGITPKQLSSILRFRRAAAFLRQGQLSLPEIALASGYFDQSHMNRDFRQFAHTTPAVYAQRIL